MARELVGSTILFVVMFVLANYLDLFERLAELTRRYEETQIDEIFSVIVLWAPILVVFSYRRWRERVRAMTVHEETEKSLRIITNSVPVILFAVDRKGTITLSEGRSLRALGLEPGQVVGMSIYNVFPGVPEILEYFPRALAGEEVAFTMNLAGVILEVTYSPLRDEEGDVTSVIGVAYDTTERKQAKEAFKESEERLRAVVASVPVVLFTLDCEGVFTLSEGKSLKALGLKPGEVVGLSAFELYRDIPQIAEDIRRALAGEVFNTLMDVAGLTFEVWYSPLRIENNEAAGVIGVAVDVTERQRVEEELKKLSYQNELILNSTGEGIFGLNPQGEAEFVNPAAASMLGYEIEELIGKHWHDTVHYSRLDGTPHPIEECLINAPLRYGAVSRETDEVFWRKDGTNFPIEYISTPMWENGKIIGVVVAFSDIAERKKAEQALRKSQERLVNAQRIAHVGNWEYDTKRNEIYWSNELYRIYGLAPQQFVPTWDAFIELVHPEDREAIERSICEGQDNLLHRIVRLNGEVRVVQSHREVNYDEAGRPVRITGTVQDVTEREETQKALVTYEQTEKNLRRTLEVLLALREAGQILGSTLESEEILTKLLEIMRSVSGLTTTVISRENERGQMRIWQAVGIEGLWSRARYAPEAEAARRGALETGEHQLFRLRRPGPRTEYLAGLCLPLRMRGRVAGVLEAYGPESFLAEKDAGAIMDSLTAQAASALENAQLYEELAEREKRLEDLVCKLFAAQEEERRRVAYEVHDTVTQVAVATHQLLQSFADYHPPSSDEGRQELELIVELAQRTIREARSIIGDLRPTELDDFGLATALRLQVEALREKGWQIGYKETLGDERLPAAVETALFRVAQEALINVGKHARTTRTHVTLELLPGEVVRLQVRDWGRGFRPDESTVGGGPGERVGISSMRERIALLGGELEISSQLDAGTSVVAEVPLLQHDSGRGDALYGARNAIG